MEYGIPLEDGAYIDMDVDKYDFKMERKDIATYIDNFKFAVNLTDYYHKEVEPDGESGQIILINNWKEKSNLPTHYLTLQV